MSHYMNWYRANSKVCITRPATYPNVATTSRSAPEKESKQRAPPQKSTNYYQHAYRDGRLEQVVLRHLGAAEGDTVIAKDIRLPFAFSLSLALTFPSLFFHLLTVYFYIIVFQVLLIWFPHLNLFSVLTIVIAFC